jgi:UDP-N-acetylglucosamine 2-epimerase (non-hydrolysing)
VWELNKTNKTKFESDNVMKEKLKILSIFGTRPEAIKMAPVIRELEKHTDQINSRLCVTNQHRKMLDQVLKTFDIKPDYDLDIMQDNQSPTQVASMILSKLEPIFENEKPDWVLVQGDTTTMMAASIAAFYSRIKVGHIEAGLRTHNKWQPFPEEINRRISTAIADLHFAPTEQSKQNLIHEGVPAENVLVTGNTIIDALQWTTAQKQFDPKVLNVDLGDKKLILVTAHRRENFGEPLENICLSLRSIAERYTDRVQIVYPVHLNPNVQGPVIKSLSNIKNITLLPPLDYLAMVWLMKHAYLVLTDSGGIQEEAPSLGKPVLVLRNFTERPEAVAAGTVRIVGTDREKIEAETMRLLENETAYNRMARASNPYGDGHAAVRIVEALLF